MSDEPWRPACWDQYNAVIEQTKRGRWRWRVRGYGIGLWERQPMSFRRFRTQEEALIDLDRWCAKDRAKERAKVEVRR